MRTVAAVEIPKVSGKVKKPTFCSTLWAASGVSPRLPAMPAAISHDHHWPMLPMTPAVPSLSMVLQPVHAFQLHPSQHCR